MSRRLLALGAVFAMICSLACPALVSARGYGEIFNFYNHPDYPEHYLQGQLGVLLPKVARSFLVVAYRYLDDKKLTGDEQKNVKTLIENRWVEKKFACDADSSSWLSIRATVPGVEKKETIASVLPLNGNSWEDNEVCNIQSDAFRTAAETLKARIKEFGIDSPKVKTWLSAQDTVFSNSGGENMIPEPLAADTDKILQKDRAYQIAAALFYAREFTDSLAKFDEIARDQDSPWRTIAPYLACRALIRQATWASEKPDLDLLSQAEKRLQNFLQDETAKEYHAAAQRLLTFVLDRTQPAKRLAEMSKTLKTEISAETLDEYTRVFDRVSLPGESNGDTSASSSSSPVLASDEMSDWIDTFQSQTEESARHALARWQETRTALWLMPLLPNLEKLDESSAAKVVAAGRELPAGSPAYPSAGYYMAKYLVRQKKLADARTLVDEVLSNQQQPLGASSRCLLLSVRIPLAESLPAFLKFGIAQPTGTSFGTMPFELPYTLERVNTDAGASYYKDVKNDHAPQLMPEAAYLSDRDMPLSLLKAACASEQLTATVALTVTRAVWVKAVLLKNESIARDIAARLVKIDKTHAGRFLGYLNATTPQEREFAAAFVMLHDDLFDPLISRMETCGEHWWWDSCTPHYEDRDIDHPAIETRLPFVSQSDLSAAAAENARLGNVKNATAYLCSIVMNWAKTHPVDARLPEALHFLVRETHFGPSDDNKGQYSKSAFQLLHSKYPGSPWTRKTPYWYN